MPPAYIFMAAGLVSFACMGIVHKLGDRSGAQPLGIAMFAMITASAVSLLYMLFFQEAVVRTIPVRAALLALPFGISAGLALWFFQVGLRYGRIATSWLLINLSAGVPTVLSLLFFHEALTPKKSGALILVIASLILLWWDRRKSAGIV